MAMKAFGAAMAVGVPLPTIGKTLGRWTNCIATSALQNKSALKAQEMFGKRSSLAAYNE
jgi:hypothetical protein